MKINKGSGLLRVIINTRIIDLDNRTHPTMQINRSGRVHRSIFDSDWVDATYIYMPTINGLRHSMKLRKNEIEKYTPEGMFSGLKAHNRIYVDFTRDNGWHVYRNGTAKNSPHVVYELGIHSLWRHND